MSKHNPKVKKSADLDAILENKHIAEVAKADLLEQNHILKLHESNDRVVEESEMKEDEIRDDTNEKITQNAAFQVATPPIYIKDPEDMERIARNSAKAFDNAVKEAPVPNAVEQLFELQMKTMGLVMEFWSAAFGMANKPNKQQD